MFGRSEHRNRSIAHMLKSRRRQPVGWVGCDSWPCGPSHLSVERVLLSAQVGARQGMSRKSFPEKKVASSWGVTAISFLSHPDRKLQEQWLRSAKASPISRKVTGSHGAAFSEPTRSMPWRLPNEDRATLCADIRPKPRVLRQMPAKTGMMIILLTP
jgi:hypothetical protein